MKSATSSSLSLYSLTQGYMVAKLGSIRNKRTVSLYGSDLVEGRLQGLVEHEVCHVLLKALTVRIHSLNPQPSTLNPPYDA
jgi:hypothetical protein